MLPLKSIARIFVAEVLSKLVLGLSHVLVIRVLAVGEFGRFSLLYAAAFAAANFSGVALNRAMMVETSAAGGAERPLVAGGLMSCLGGLLLLPIVALVARCGAVETLGVATFVLGYLLIDYLRCLHQAEMRFREYSLIEVARSALIAVATGVALWFPSWLPGGVGRPEGILLAQGAVMLALAAPWVYWVRRPRRSVSAAGALAGWRESLGAGRLALFFYFAAVGLLGQIEVFVLNRLATEAELAVYSAAFRYYSLLLLATGAVSAVLTPLSQRTESAHGFLEVLRKSRGYFLVFGAVALSSIPVLYLLRDLLGLSKYPGFLSVYAVLSLASVQAILLSPHVSALMRVRDHAFLNALAYAVIGASVVSCALLVRSLGALGAALSYLAANLVLNGVASRRAVRLIRASSPRSAHEVDRHITESAGVEP